MIRRYLWIILLLFAIPCYALNPFQAFMMSAGASGAAAEYCASCTGVCIDCEDMGSNTDCDAGAGEALFCRKSYTIVNTGATFTWNTSNTTSQCVGFSNTYDLSISGDGNAASAHVEFTPAANIYALINIKVSDLPTLSEGTGTIVYRVRTSSATSNLDCFQISVYNDSGTYKWRLFHRGTSSADVYDLGATINTSEWAKHQIYWETNKTTGTGITWSINGADQGATSNATTADRTPGSRQFYVGKSSMVVDYDSVRIQTDAEPTCN